MTTCAAATTTTEEMDDDQPKPPSKSSTRCACTAWRGRYAPASTPGPVDRRRLAHLVDADDDRHERRLKRLLNTRPPSRRSYCAATSTRTSCTAASVSTRTSSSPANAAALASALGHQACLRGSGSATMRPRGCSGNCARPTAATSGTGEDQQATASSRRVWTPWRGWTAGGTGCGSSMVSRSGSCEVIGEPTIGDLRHRHVDLEGNSVPSCMPSVLPVRCAGHGTTTAALGAPQGTAAQGAVPQAARPQVPSAALAGCGTHPARPPGWLSSGLDHLPDNGVRARTPAGGHLPNWRASSRHTGSGATEGSTVPSATTFRP